MTAGRKPKVVHTTPPKPKDETPEEKVPLPWETNGTLASSIYDLGRLVMAMRRETGLDPAQGVKLAEVMLQYQLNLKISQNQNDLNDLFRAPEEVQEAKVEE